MIFGELLEGLAALAAARDGSAGKAQRARSLVEKGGFDYGSLGDSQKDALALMMGVCMESAPEMVAEIVKMKNFDFARQSWTGQHPVHFCIRSCNVECLELFLEKLALAPGGVDMAGADGNTFLACAAMRGAHAGVIESLLRAGADPDAQNGLGLTPLMHAVICNAGDAQLALLARASDLSVKCKATGKTAFEMAGKRAREVLLPYVERGLLGSSVSKTAPAQGKAQL